MFVFKLLLGTSIGALLGFMAGITFHSPVAAILAIVLWGLSIQKEVIKSVSNPSR